MRKTLKVFVLLGLTLSQASAKQAVAEADVNATAPSQTRSLRCIPILRLFNLELRQSLRAGENVGITGSHERLGEWRVERSVDMQRRDKSGLKWYLHLTLCASESIYYRYFIYQRDARGNRRIRRWEGHQHARVLRSYDISRQLSADIFGELYREWLVGVEQERGWLRCDYMLELKFVWEQHFRFERNDIDMNHTAAAKYALKLLVYQDDGPAATQSIADTLVEVSRYAYNRSHFRPQREAGVLYTQGDVLVFRIIAPLRTSPHSYQLTISSAAGEQLAYVSILSLDLHTSSGTLRLPIHSATSGFEIGQLTLPYLNVQPLPGIDMSLRGSFHHYWPLNWPTLDVGHRGLGKSYYDSQARYTENTIRSLLAAQRLRADMVELDVRVTRDYVSVLWHEQGFYTAPHGRWVGSAADLRYVLIEQLSYSRLKSKRVFVYKHGQWHEYTWLNVRSAAVLERIFPTLEEVYLALPLTLGLMVEIKWPQLGQYAEQLPQRHRGTLDKNRYVDGLLEHALNSGCGRPLIFTSLDADICTLLRHKQHMFPVLFVASGESALWRPFLDLRTSSFREAVNFAQSEELLGTAAHAEDLLADGEQQLQQKVELGLQLLQAVFVWGEDLNSASRLRLFQRAQVSGLIYDRLEEHGTWRKRASFFSAPELLEIYARQCSSEEGGDNEGAVQADSCVLNRHIKMRYNGKRLK